MLAPRAPALYKDNDGELPKRELHVEPGFAAYRRLTLRCKQLTALGACAQFLGEALVVESEARRDHSAPGGRQLHLPGLADWLFFRMIEIHGLTN